MVVYTDSEVVVVVYTDSGVVVWWCIQIQRWLCDCEYELTGGCGAVYRFFVFVFLS